MGETAGPALATGVAGAARAEERAASPHERVRRVEAALEAVESLPGASREVALDALEALLALYGDALARVLDRLGAAGERVEPARLAEDELIGHLLMVHGLHPLGFEDPADVPGAPGGPPLVQIGIARTAREGWSP